MPRFLGIVDVPVFEPAFTMPGAGTAAFDNVSDIPAYRPDQVYGGNGQVTTGRFRGINLDGVMNYTKAQAGLVSGSIPCWKDGRIMSYLNYKNETIGVDSISFYYIGRQTAPRVPGNYVFNQAKSQTSFSRLESHGPIWKHSLSPAAGGFVATYGYGFLWSKSTSGRQQARVCYQKANGGIDFCDAFNVEQSISDMGIGTDGRGENWAMCNSSPILGSALGWNIGPTDYPDLWSNTLLIYTTNEGLRLIKWKNTEFLPNDENPNGTIRDINFDNPFLQDAAEVNFVQGSSRNGWITAWHGGFLCTLVTNGTGPTRQRCEAVVMDRNANGYYLLRLIPQTANAERLLAATTGVLSFKVDSEGTIWFRQANSTADVPLQSLVFYSYAPFLFFNPRTLDIDLPSIDLPCYNTCIPGYI